MTKETIIKSALKYLVKMQIEEGSVGFAVDNDPDHDCCWDDVLAWIEAQSSEEDFVKHKKEVLERIAKREREIDKYMKELEALEQQPCEDCISREAVIKTIKWWFDKIELNPDILIDSIITLPSVIPQTACEDAVSRQAVLNIFDEWFATCNIADKRESPKAKINALPSVKPKYTDEEIDKAQAVEQAYVDKMVELAVEETKRPKGKWIGEKPYPICDKCGCNIYEEYISCSDFAEIYKPMNYCPNCGAYMGGGEDET